MMTIIRHEYINGVLTPVCTEYPNACEEVILNLIKNNENPNISQEQVQLVINEARKNGWNKILAYFGIYS